MKGFSNTVFGLGWLAILAFLQVSLLYRHVVQVHGAMTVVTNATPSLYLTAVEPRDFGAIVLSNLSNPSFDSNVAEWWPRAVIFAHTDDEVQQAVLDCIQHNWTVQVRAGRHGYLAWLSESRHQQRQPAPPPFCIIDVSNVSSVAFVPGSGGLFVVGAGVRQFELYTTLNDRGFGFPGGTCPTVGIGGFALGGGFGYWSRAWGLTSDNIEAVTVVLVRGRDDVTLVTANTTHHPELLWACRGGGSNLAGVVTSLTIRAYPRPTMVTHWRLNFPRSSCCSHVLPLYGEVGPESSRKLALQLVIYSGSCSIVAVGMDLHPSQLYDSMQGDRFSAIPGALPTSPIRSYSWMEAIDEFAGCKNISNPNRCWRDQFANDWPNPAVHGIWNAMSIYFPWGWSAEKASANVTESLCEFVTSANEGKSNIAFSRQPASMPDALEPGIDQANHFGGPEQPFILAMLDTYGGKVNDPTSNATAFPHRNMSFHVQLLAYSDATQVHRTQALLHQGLEAFDHAAKSGSASDFSSSSYRNYPNALLPFALRRYFGAVNLARLRSLKEQYDPLRVFRQAQDPGGR